VIEQEVNEKFVTAHVQEYLPPDEGEPCAQLQQEFSHVIDQSAFDFTLSRLFC